MRTMLGNFSLEYCISKHRYNRSSAEQACSKTFLEKAYSNLNSLMMCRNLIEEQENVA